MAGMGILLGAVGASLGMLLGDEAGLALGVAAALLVWLILWTVAVANGDDVLLGMSKAQEIQSTDHPLLWNVVEEMSIAAALPKMPRVFIVEDPAPNAFATGRKQEKAAVAVTTGLLGMLDRNELQGVVAHELGHIKNRDVALIVTAGVMVGAIALLADVGRRAMFYGGAPRSRSSNRNGNGVLAIAAVLLLVLAPIFAQLMYFALSRRREFLADASGARFSRYPEGLASALEKISGTHLAQRDQSRVTAPMYIMPPVHPGALAAHGGRGSWFSTHPPVELRVKVLRSMGGGAGVADYLRAYEGVTGNRLLRTQPEDSGMAARSAVAGGVAAAVAQAPRARVRAASEALLTAGGWHIRKCGGCGAVVKVPPPLQNVVQNCPRCGVPLVA